MTTPPLNLSNWVPIGPAPIDTAGGLDQISGRIQIAAPDPGNALTIYLGSDNGGIWKNINAPSWTPLTDQMPSLALGANFGKSFGAYHTLVVHPADNNLVLGLVSGVGAGILQSTDGGNTWNLLANNQFDGQGLNSIAVHPTDTSRLYVAAGSNGVWKSTDGGASWQQLGTLPSGLVSDLIIARFDANTLYAAVVGNTGTTQAQNGVYVSSDQGNTWTLLGGGLATGAALGSSAAVRIESGAATGVVYVSMLTVSGSAAPTAVQRFSTSDGGTSWSALAASGGGLEGRSWHLLLGVDPGDDSHIFVNDSYYLNESTDGGATWSHADNNVGYLAIINPFDWVNITFDANRNALLTADQGVVLYDPANQSWSSLMGNLQVSEFYTIALDPETANVAYAVGQDIFCEKYTGGYAWNVMEHGIGELGKILVDFTNSNQLYGFNPRSLSNFVMQSPDGGSTWTTIFPRTMLSSSFLHSYGTGYGFAGASQKAFAMDPSNPARLLVVADRVYETTNANAAAPTWAQISGVLSPNSHQSFVIAIAIAPSAPSTVYAATQEGGVWVTYNDGGEWSGLSGGNTGISGQVLGFNIDPENNQHVFAVGYSAVWHLLPSGPPWVNITGNLPTNISYYTLFVDWGATNPVLILGTDRGIYRSFDLGNTWLKWSPGLPNTRVNDLQGEILNGQLLLAAATIGRGAWEILFTLSAIVWQGDTSYWNQGLTVYSFGSYEDAVNNWSTGDNAMFKGELSTQNGAELPNVPAGWLAVCGTAGGFTDPVLFMIVYYCVEMPLQFGADGAQTAVVVPNASLPTQFIPTTTASVQLYVPSQSPWEQSMNYAVFQSCDEATAFVAGQQPGSTSWTEPSNALASGSGPYFPKGSETVGGWLVLYGTSGDSVMPYVITFWSWDVNLCASPCCITDYSQPMLFWANVLTGSGSIVWQGDTSYWNQGLTVYVFDNYQDAANNWGTGDNAMFYGELSTQNGAELTGIPAGWLAVSGLNSQSTDAVLFMIMYFSAGEPLQFGADGPQAAVVVPNASLPPQFLPTAPASVQVHVRGDMPWVGMQYAIFSSCDEATAFVAGQQPGSIWTAPSNPLASGSGSYFPKGSGTVGGWVVLYGDYEGSGEVSDIPFVITFWSWNANLCASPCITDYSQPMLFCADRATSSIVWQGDTSYWDQGLTVYSFAIYEDAINNWSTGENAVFTGKLAYGVSLTGVPAGWLAVCGTPGGSTPVLFMIVYYFADVFLQFSADGMQPSVVVWQAAQTPTNSDGSIALSMAKKSAWGNSLNYAIFQDYTDALSNWNTGTKATSTGTLTSEGSPATGLNGDWLVLYGTCNGNQMPFIITQYYSDIAVYVYVGATSNQALMAVG